MKVTIRGQEHDVTREAVLAAMFRVEPEPLEPGGWYVVIRRKRYPVKQPLRRLLGIQGQAFHTRNALSILSRLGFTIGQEDQA